MHPNPIFRPIGDHIAPLLVREIGFAALFAATGDGLRVGHAPVLLSDDDRVLRFHLARGNALAELADGAPLLAVVQGPDAYVNPQDYGDEAQVPTWNYVAVEMEGTLRRTDRDALIRLLDDLSAQHEARIGADPAWTRSKMTDAAFGRMLDAIFGFELEIRAWRPTVKLGQNKLSEVRANVAEALATRGQGAISSLMVHLGGAEKGM